MTSERAYAVALAPSRTFIKGLGGPNATIEERLFGRCFETDTGCWEWNGHVSPTGYGKMRYNSVEKTTHRLAWEIAVGSIPEGKYVLHQCDNPRCCNPNPGHLYIGTQLENIHDIFDRNRWVTHYAVRTHCKRGHEFTPSNTQRTKGGHRRCRQCRKQRGN